MKSLLETLLSKTNRTASDIKRAIDNGSFEVEADRWDAFVKEEGWYIDEEEGQFYPSFEELSSDKKLAASLDLEIVENDGQQYVVVIVR